jgi:hypothetical protein
MNLVYYDPYPNKQVRRAITTACVGPQPCALRFGPAALGGAAGVAPVPLQLTDASALPRHQLSLQASVGGRAQVTVLMRVCVCACLALQLEEYIWLYGALLRHRGEPPVAVKRLETVEEVLKEADVSGGGWWRLAVGVVFGRGRHAQLLERQATAPSRGCCVRRCPCTAPLALHAMHVPDASCVLDAATRRWCRCTATWTPPRSTS